jgi:hypothetical protein
MALVSRMCEYRVASALHDPRSHLDLPVESFYFYIVRRTNKKRRRSSPSPECVISKPGSICYRKATSCSLFSGTETTYCFTDEAELTSAPALQLQPVLAEQMVNSTSTPGSWPVVVLVTYNSVDRTVRTMSGKNMLAYIVVVYSYEE